MSTVKHPQVGPLFVDWLKEEGTHEEVTTSSIKRVLAWQIEGLRAEIKNGRESGECIPAEDVFGEVRARVAAVDARAARATGSGKPIGPDVLS